MIRNERQYRITKSRAEKFEQALLELAREPKEGVHPLIAKAEEDGLRSQLETLRREIQEYEELQSGNVRRIEIQGWHDIPIALIRGRIAAGLTQRELAERLGLAEQQIQKYEATAYAGAGWERIAEVAEALGLEFHGEGTFATA